MDGLGPVLMGLLVVSCWAAPVILAKLLADTLDGAPYLIALSVGIAVGAVLCVVRWTVVRGALASFGSAVRVRPRSCSPSPLVRRGP